jgi:beta-glucuronidase
MLYPQSNAFRQSIALSDLWDFRADPEGTGEAAGWGKGFSDGQPITVPGSWNEQLAEVYNYWGDAWYQTRFALPWGWRDKRIRVRFGSVNYLADVWLNGVKLGQHEGGHLPFDFDVTPCLKDEENRLVVRVNGDLRPERVPPGNVPDDRLDSFVHTDQYPRNSYDFFPFCGIHRPVLLYAVSPQAINDLAVATTMGGSDGLVHVTVERASDGPATVRLTLTGHGVEIVEEAAVTGAAVEMTLRVPHAALWSHATPNLYDLTAELVQNGAVIDRYTLPIGIRTVAVQGDKLLLNGEPVMLKGFGRHEDFPVVGRGYMPALIVKDYDLMRWVGANSFRTTHYPYSEPMMDLADRLGFLVIDETPAVGMFHHGDGLAHRMRVWEQQIREMIARDRNHPSVIMWSLANEPHNRRPEARSHFKRMFDVARSLDSTRPVTFATYLGLADQSLEWCDVICLNRYNAWYSQGGQLDLGLRLLSEELDAIYAQFPRPLILSEFGADTVAGMHADPPLMFTEEYQVEMLTRYIRLLNEKPYVVGQHVWNMCDFRTAQSPRRVGGLNLKGVFTRDRRPKMAAHRLRELWRGGAG